MIKLDKRGRRANNEQLAEVLHKMNPGDVIKIAGKVGEASALANSLSRTHKVHNKTRFSVHKHRSNPIITITCIRDRSPDTYIVI